MKRRVRKQEVAWKRAEGRMKHDMPEDRRAIYNRLRLPKLVRIASAPVPVKEPTFCSMREVEVRLMRAMKTIRALPDRERRFQALRGASIPYIQEYMDAYAASDPRVPVFMPTPQDVSDCLVALSWVRNVDRNLWKIMWLRSFDFSFGLIGRYIGRSDETVRRWFREGITDAWSAANGT